jgi:hypothetical protein
VGGGKRDATYPDVRVGDALVEEGREKWKGGKGGGGVSETPHTLMYASGMPSSRKADGKSPSSYISDVHSQTCR